MSSVDCTLEWLARFKPLWDFLTAIGTVSLAALTVWLATRKPKLRLAVSVGYNGQMLSIRIVNDGTATPVVQKCELLSDELKFGRIDIQETYRSLNSIAIGVGVARLATGDVQEVYCILDDLGANASAALPADLSEERVESAVRNA